MIFRTLKSSGNRTRKLSSQPHSFTVLLLAMCAGWATGSSAETVSVVQDINQQTALSEFTNSIEIFTSTRDAFFVADFGSGEPKMYRTRGGATKVVKFTHRAMGSLNRILAVTRRHVFFVTDDDGGKTVSLWKSSIRNTGLNAKRFLKLTVDEHTGDKIISRKANDNELYFIAKFKGSDQKFSFRIFRTSDNGERLFAVTNRIAGEIVNATSVNGRLFLQHTVRLGTSGLEAVDRLSVLRRHGLSLHQIRSFQNSAGVATDKYVSSNNRKLKNIGNGSYFYFYVQTFSSQSRENQKCEFWRSDGTDSGTVRIMNSSTVGFNGPMQSASCPRIIGQHLNRVVYFANGSIYMSDGERTSTRRLFSQVKGADRIDFNGDYKVIDGVLWLTAKKLNKTNLWRFDMVNAEKKLIHRFKRCEQLMFQNRFASQLIVQIASGCRRGRFVKYGNYGIDIDGRSINKISSIGKPVSNTVGLGTRLLTLAYNGRSGVDLVGNNIDESSVKTLSTYSDYTFGIIDDHWSGGAYVKDGKAWFCASVDSQKEIQQIWYSDGSSAGTRPAVKDLGVPRYPDYSGRGRRDCANKVTIGDTLYFTRDDYQNGMELWQSTLTGENQQLVVDLRHRGKDSGLSQLSAVNDRLVFAVKSSGNGRPQLVTLTPSLEPEILNGMIESPRIIGGDDRRLWVFSAATGTVWETDGSPAGTQQRIAESGNLKQVVSATEISGNLYLVASRKGQSRPRQLHLFELKLGATTLRRIDFASGGQKVARQLLKTTNDELVFLTEDADDLAGGERVWRYRPGEDVQQLWNGGRRWFTRSVGRLGSDLYIMAEKTNNSNFAQWNLFRLDGDRWVTLHRESWQGSESSTSTLNINGLYGDGNTLWFFASTPTTGAELWHVTP